MDKYILDEMNKLNKLAQEGASPNDVVAGLDKLKELIIKNEQMKAKMNDPDRLQPFGTEVEPKPIVNSAVELQPFGTPDEPDSKGLGGM